MILKTSSQVQKVLINSLHVCYLRLKLHYFIIKPASLIYILKYRLSCLVVLIDNVQYEMNTTDGSTAAAAIRTFILGLMGE